jgi:CBS domain-containing protein
MAERIRDVMTPSPKTVDASQSIAETAKLMRDGDVGAVIVLQGRRLGGIATDRDIAVRAVAQGRDPEKTTVGEIVSKDVTALRPDDNLDRGVELMRKKAVRRLPVMAGEQPVGIVSLGDLAIECDAESVLAQISAAPPNR